MSRIAKHVPLRTCVICRDKSEKRRLTRLVSTAEGVFVDPTGKQAGRGAYLCDNPLCSERAIKSDVLSKALRTSLTADDRERIRVLVS